MNRQAAARLLAPLIFLPLLGAGEEGDLTIQLERIRNEKGMVHLCLTSEPAHFPSCGDDPRAVKRNVAASEIGKITFTGITPGAYALSALHDENRNGKLDTFLGIPREGFGFSRNPVIRFGAPRFGQVRFDIKPGITRQTVRMQYLL